ncbi:MAG: hypothetical protein HY348_10040 [Nitrospira defluvii]|nr:hypothetical protein [Nitrospira defluvii]
METVLGILSSGLSGAVLVWLLRNWISERLKQSIQHEYSEKLEIHKAQIKIELDFRIEKIKHEYELNKLRTSLFFDHQREAFNALLEAILDLNNKWNQIGRDPDGFISEAAPHAEYHRLRNLCYKKQLFLDDDCMAALELLSEILESSFPFEDGEGKLHDRDTRAAYDKAQYLQPRIASILQGKIGVIKDRTAKREIAILGAVLILNNYCFAEIGLPVKGHLKLLNEDDAGDIVSKGDEHFEELLAKLKEFQFYLRKKGCFDEAALKVSRFLSILTATA